MTPAGPFEVLIDSLVLDGVAPRAGSACAQAFEIEFEQLVRVRGFPEVRPGGDPSWRIPALSMSCLPTDPPARVGKALAVTLFNALHSAAEGL